MDADGSNGTLVGRSMQWMDMLLCPSDSTVK